MATVNVYARTDKRDAAGTIPLFLRIAHKNNTRYVSLGLRVKERHWNPQAQQVRKSNPDHAKLNHYLADRVAEAQSIVADLLSQKEKITARTIQARMKAGDDGETKEIEGNFIAYCEARLEEYRRRGQISTWKAYRTALHKLGDYVRLELDREDLPFGAITLSLMRGLQTYMVEDLGNGPNTVHKNMTSLHTMLRSAIKEELFPWEKDPFRHIKLRKERPIKAKLTLEDIRRIEQVALDSGTLLWHVRNWFLFAFYAGGMRFSDVATVQWKHLVRQGNDYFLNYKMQKTREGQSTLLVGQALSILAHYTDREEDREASIFNILDGYDVSTPMLRRSAIESRNALTNKYLKKVQLHAGLKTHLTFHLARHSLADYLRKQGFSIYDISKVLGHANTSITEQYLKGFDREDLNEKMRRVF
jgi:site-specific recombinase XerD